MTQMAGRSSLLFERPPYIMEAASIVGKKEGDGPLGHLILKKIRNSGKIHGKKQRVNCSSVPPGKL